MLEADAKVEETRRILLERVIKSRSFDKAARLRDLLIYLCSRVIDHGVSEIGEQEVGCQVFDRLPNYDTMADSIVRVHASMLRKRLEHYFESEGRYEPVIIEIPKGNYAPVFRERFSVALAGQHSGLPAPLVQPIALPPALQWRRPYWWKLWAVLALAFACSTLYLYLHFARSSGPAGQDSQERSPTVRRFWSRVFGPDPPTDIVVEDASLALYQQIFDQNVTLSEYADRQYQNNPPVSPKIDQRNQPIAHAILAQSYTSSFVEVFLSNLLHTAMQLNGRTGVVSSRGYTFHQLDMHNAVLLGNGVTNPWIQAFDNQLGLRWKYDKTLGIYYPQDTWAPADETDQYHTDPNGGAERVGYASVSFLPNPKGTGNVAIFSATGGASYAALSNFLTLEGNMAQLRSRLPNPRDPKFPYFEALFRVVRRPWAAPEVTIVLCRPPRLDKPAKTE